MVRDTIDKRRAEVRQTLQQVLGDSLHDVGSFGSRWIYYAGCTPQSIKKNYELLQEIGFSDSIIAKNITLLALLESTIRKNYDFLNEAGVDHTGLIRSPQLLGLNTKILNRNYQNLFCLGVENAGNRRAEILRKCPQILYKDPTTLKTKLRFLKGKGLKEEKVLANLSILAQSVNTLKSRWIWMNKIGLSDENIATNVHLLTLNNETLRRNYCNLRRYFEKEKIATFATLLGLPPETINAHIQFLHFWGLTSERVPLACLSHPYTKRKKVAWLMKQIIRPGHTKEESKGVVDKLRKLFNNNPNFLVWSLATLENKQEKIVTRMRNW